MSNQEEHHRPLVLIAEEDKASRYGYEAMLQQAGYDVAVVPCAEAPKASRTLHPALIILQLVDPAVSGMELIREFRTDADTRATPVITLLRFDDAHTREQIVRAGGTAIFIEPVRPPMLLRQLRRLLARVVVAAGARHTMKTAAAPFPSEA